MINNTLYVLSTTIEEGGEVDEGEEESEFASHQPCYRTTTFDAVHANHPEHRMFFDTIEVPNSYYNRLLKCDQVYVAAIFYSDGDTFGETHGYFQLQGVFETSEEAIAANTLALKNEGYKPWEGYFSSLIGPEVFVVPFIK